MSGEKRADSHFLLSTLLFLLLCLSSVQLWFCDAKLMGAKLSSIHTLAYNALRLIPTHTNTKLFSLSLSLSPPHTPPDPSSRLTGTHMHPPTSPLYLALSFPSFLLAVLVYSFLFWKIPPLVPLPMPLFLFADHQTLWSFHTKNSYIHML